MFFLYWRGYGHMPATKTEEIKAGRTLLSSRFDRGWLTSFEALDLIYCSRVFAYSQFSFTVPKRIVNCASGASRAEDSSEDDD